MKLNFLQPWAALWRCSWEHCAKAHMLSRKILALLWNQYEPLATDPKWSTTKNSSTLSQVSLPLRLKGTLAPSVALCTCACLRKGQNWPPSFHKAAHTGGVCSARGILGSAWHILDLHAGSNTFTWATDSHTKAFLHLSKRVVHVPSPL